MDVRARRAREHPTPRGAEGDARGLDGSSLAAGPCALSLELNTPFWKMGTVMFCVDRRRPGYREEGVRGGAPLPGGR